MKRGGSCDTEVGSTQQSQGQSKCIYSNPKSQSPGSEYSVATRDVCSVHTGEVLDNFNGARFKGWEEGGQP